MTLPPNNVFPFLNASNHRITSPITPKYNCIAWAAGDDKRFWWPDVMAYWPPNIPRQETVESFIQAFNTIGYTLCDNDLQEEGFEKVALYIDNNNIPTHMARQLSSGLWTSKLGRNYDIEHNNLVSISGPVYGNAFQILKRLIK